MPEAEGDDLEELLDDSPAGLVCDCLQVDWRTIELTVRALGLKSVAEVTKHTGAGGGCHSCWPVIEGILERCQRGEFRFQATAADLLKARREALRMRDAWLPGLEKRNDPTG